MGPMGGMVPGGMVPGGMVPGGMAPGTTPATPPKNGEKKPDKEELTRARLIIELPADAKLFVDDRLTKATSERRSFSTPQLNDGDTYYYDLRVEVVRNGEALVETKKITLKAGDVIRADFKDMERTATARVKKD